MTISIVDIGSSDCGESIESAAVNTVDFPSSNTSGQNEFGETPLPYAPVVASVNGQAVIPQQFLDVNRTLSSVEAILSRIEVPEHFLLFAGEERGLVYLLCSVIGHENYIKRPEQRTELKIVYGRRWLLEPSTPTSEVVQTAALAVKKAREHELRERVVVYLDGDDDCQTIRTTPFNCHMDLPLMANSRSKFNAVSTSNDLNQNQIGEKDRWSVEELLGRIRVDNLQPRLCAETQLSNARVLYDITLENTAGPAHSFADLESKTISLMCEQSANSLGLDRAEFLHALFDALLIMSDKYVDETIAFDNFRRFSRTICPTDIAGFSHQTRKPVSADERFGSHFQDMSYRVDAAKAPGINNGDLGFRQREVLAEIELRYGSLAGYLPHGYSQT